jgi:regulator of protease activity HflC (stomatin/prohibitin superfamily)
MAGTIDLLRLEPGCTVMTLVIVAGVLLIWALYCVKVLKRNERGVVLRLGKMMCDWSQPLGPGIHWVWWPVEMLYRGNVFAGQEHVLGAEGQALDEIREEQVGMVQVAGKQWLATASERIPYGQNVRVVGVDGVHLRVEPGPPKNQE